MKTIGIVGFGSFGKFLAEKLDEHCEVRVYSTSGRQNKWASDLSTVAKSDLVILCIPLDAYRSMLEEIKPLLGKQSVVVDVCSVKQQPINIIREILPTQPMVATHPLFGPESAAKTLSGHTLVLCPDGSDDDSCQIIEKFADQKLGLKIVNMTLEEHDREMSVVQGLTFFIARTLDNFGLREQKLSTPSFEKLLSLARLEDHHSDDLFKTIQMGNNHSKAVRAKFLKLAKELSDNI